LRDAVKLARRKIRDVENTPPRQYRDRCHVTRLVAGVTGTHASVTASKQPPGSVNENNAAIRDWITDCRRMPLMPKATRTFSANGDHGS
jgi:hypothetical protein